MNTYNIAGLTVNMEPSCETTLTQSEKYRCSDSASPDIIIDLNRNYIENLNRDNAHLSYNECEYMSAGAQFYTQLIRYNGFLIHSSALAYENKAYLFSAPSGTGKSTHALLWKKVFGEENVISINDDKPALRLIDGKYFVFGTPFSGKTDQNENMCVPIQGICILNRAEENSIQPITAREALVPLLNQTIRPTEKIGMEKLLTLLDLLIQTVPIYKMGCNISLEAPKIAYASMK
jgi:hypothetical protein